MKPRAVIAAILFASPGVLIFSARGAETNALEFLNPDVELGTLAGGRDFPVTFVLTNYSDKVVKILNASTSCHCTTLVKAPEAIPARGSGAVELNFNSSREDGPVTQSVFVETDDKELLVAQFSTTVGPVVAGGPLTSDEFDGSALGLQWQWNANPQNDWASFSARPGFLRLASVPAPKTRTDGKPAVKNLYNAPNFLLQKFPATEFTATTELQFAPAAEGEFAGLTIFGQDYAMLGLRKTTDGLRLVYIVNSGANRPGAEEREVAGVGAKSSTAYLRVTVSTDALCQFAYSFDDQIFKPVGEPFKAAVDRWIGAKVGVIATAPAEAAKTGYADFDWFHVTAKIP